MSQLPSSHAWVPLEKCGDLSPGIYVVLLPRSVEATVGTLCPDRVWTIVIPADVDGGGYTFETPSHVLNPNMGPVPDFDEVD
jgi:hypothetical protein